MIHRHGLSVAVLEGNYYHQNRYAFGTEEDVSVGVDLENLSVVLISVEAVNYCVVVFWLLPLHNQGFVQGLGCHAGIEISFCLIDAQPFRLFY